MKTSCKRCKRPVVQRVHLTVAGAGDQSTLFVETYACGAIEVFGEVRPGTETLRRCPTIEARRGPRAVSS